MSHEQEGVDGAGHGPEPSPSDETDRGRSTEEQSAPRGREQPRASDAASDAAPADTGEDAAPPEGGESAVSPRPAPGNDLSVSASRPRRGRGAAGRLLLAGGRSVTALVSVAVLGLTGYVWTRFNQVQDSINTTTVLRDLDEFSIAPEPPPSADSSAPPPPPVEDTATDILLVGTDSRTDAHGRPLPEHVLRQLRTEAEVGLNTDTIIMLRIPDDGSAAYAISIPRDTSVPVPGLGEEKINGALGLMKTQRARELRAEGVTDPERIARESDDAGRRALIGAVGDLTGARIDHYAEISLYGFYLFTEAIGGVEVCLNRATSDSDSGANFASGYQTISGGDALSFVRQRNLPGGDLDRIVRQQVFLAALVDQVLSTGTLTDPGRLHDLLDAMQSSVVLDDALDPLVFARQLQGVAGGDVSFVTIPVTGVGLRNDRGQSIVTVDRQEVRDFVEELTRQDGEPDGEEQVGMAGPGAPALAPAAAAATGTGSMVRTQPPDTGEPITAGGVPCVN